MAEIVCSAFFQETVSRGVSFVLGKREEKASQGNLKERLEMAANELELALESSAKLPITDVSLLLRRKMIKRGYVEAMELINRDKQQVVPAGPEPPDAHGVKRKRWVICANNMSPKPFVALSTEDVRRFEWYANCAGKFVRDVESGCSLHHYTFCSPIVRHLLEGKTLQYCHHLDQGNLLRCFFIFPVYSDERGVEAVISFNFEDSTMAEKCFHLLLSLRLSESTDIVGVAIKGMQLLTTGFKLAAEFAMGELTMLSNLHTAQWYGPAWMGIEDWHIEHTKFFRPDSACCEGNRHGLCASNNVSSELLPDIFPEQVIFWSFQCYYVPAVEPNRSSCSSFGAVGRSMSTGSGQPPLLVTASFAPHEMHSGPYYLVKTIGDDEEYRDDSSIEQVVEAINSDAINCFFHHPELKRYEIYWRSKHGAALLEVERMPSKERTITHKTRRRYNTRGSTRSRRK